MVLRALYELYDRVSRDPDYEVAPEGYSYQKIAFEVLISLDGQLAAINDIRHYEGSSARPRRLCVPGGAKKTGSGLNPGFLWDNPAYMFGYDPDPRRAERARRAFEEFRKFHCDKAAHIALPEFSAVCRFLEGWHPDLAKNYAVLKTVAKTFGVFRIRGQRQFVHDADRVRAWWDARLEQRASQPTGQCLITGERAQLARLHPLLKGVAGAKSSGAALVSFNKSAYESYGQKQSFNAPVSEQAAFRYGAALNALLDGPRREKHRIVMGSTTLVFWTERPTLTEDVFSRFARGGSAALDAVQDETVRAKLEAFLRALKRGRESYSELQDDPDRTGFYILALAPNAARISIRFFRQGTLGELLDNLRRHHGDIRVVREKRDDPEFPSLSRFLQQTERGAAGVPAPLAASLLDSVISGRDYPQALYTAVMRRIVADHTVSYTRASIIKGYLVRNQGKEATMGLDLEREDPAYRLGRLFAALEKTQQDALGTRLSATIRNRFYSSASATPGTVFPRLLRTYQHHLGKLEGGHRVSREKLIQEILGPLGRFPAHLGLAEQGMFALGYYHQRQDMFTPKSDRAKREDDDILEEAK